MCNNRLLIIMFIMIMVLSNNVEAQNSEEQQDMGELGQSDQPSKELVIAVVTIMFSVTFLLLAYVRFCRVNPHNQIPANPNHRRHPNGPRFSGIDRRVIETLPFFKFSSIKGSKEGLECTVCLSKFEDSEVLRLLPKCQHAFHVACIDTWLEGHSTCPLCRYKVEPGDIKNLIANSLSSRSLRVPSNLTDDPNLEIYIQREPPSSQFDAELEGGSGGGGAKRKKCELNHRIVISDVFARSRWSDLNSSDLISLSFEMLDDVSSARFSVSGSNENSFTALNPAAAGEKIRSMSEIANVARFAAGTGKRLSGVHRKYSAAAESGGGEREERLWRIWMPIAKRTVQWFARRERNSNELQHRAFDSNV